jgi:SAM-dependent methyltransferase
MTEERTPDVTVRVRFPEPPDVAFSEVTRTMASALARMRLAWTPGPDSTVQPTEGPPEPTAVGRIEDWVPGQGFRIVWPSLPWASGERSSVDFQFRDAAGGTELTIRWSGWTSYLRERGPGDLPAWFAGELAAPLVLASSTDRFADWVTDRSARRPSGTTSAKVYRDPIYHRPNFRAILEALRLTPADRLVEVGCGGGAFLKEALKSGCTASAIDHSEELLEVAREQNRDAIDGGRLSIVEGDAGTLPFPSGQFTCAVMTGVLPFLPDPVRTLSEIRRVLVPDGRLVLFTGSAALRGTPAAPEPIASRLRFYDDAALVALAEQAGFSSASVVHPELGRYAREEGVPAEGLWLFDGPPEGGQLLLARR